MTPFNPLINFLSYFFIKSKYMDQKKINVECSDPMSYKHTNKRVRYGDIPKENQKKKYKPLEIPKPPKLDEKKIFTGM